MKCWWKTSIQKFQDEAGTMGNTSWNTSWNTSRNTTWVKTKIQNVGSGNAPASMTIAGQTVAVTNKFTYLGSEIDSSGYCSRDIRRRLGLDSSTMGQIDSRRNKRLMTPTRYAFTLHAFSRCCSIGQKPGHY